MPKWTPFRPKQQDLERIDREVGEMPAIQQKLIERHPDLKVGDRVAHQYQVAGSKVNLRVEPQLPDNLSGIGLFEPGAEHIGIGRISTGLGCPHLETDPDFLGLMLAFQTKSGQRVDFLGINHPGAPTDTHQEFMSLLDATAEGAGAEPIFGSGVGELDIANLLASNFRIVTSLKKSQGKLHGLGIALHVAAQTARTAKSSTAYQTYWTGVIEIGGVPGKFTMVPATDENEIRSLASLVLNPPGERHLTHEWRERQAKSGVVFDLNWLPYIDEERTSLTNLTEGWEEQPHLIARVSFPQSDGTSEQDQLWAALASEMGANPGNWVRNKENSIPEPGTEFTYARKFAYRKSQAGRNVLPEVEYAHVFEAGEINATLAGELKRRRAKKKELGHVDHTPG